jgi:cell division protein FtsB
VKTKLDDTQPRRSKRTRKIWETFEWRRIEELEQRTDRLQMTAADLQTAVDALTATVAKVSAEVAVLKSAQPVIEQAQLDANTQAVVDANTALNAL